MKTSQSVQSIWIITYFGTRTMLSRIAAEVSAAGQPIGILILKEGELRTDPGRRTGPGFYRHLRQYFGTKE